MKTFRTVICFGFMLTAFLTGCSKPQNAIVGTWKGSNTEPMQFFKDGTFSSGSFSGNYTFPDDTHLRLGNGSDSTVGTFKIDGDTMTLTLDVQGSTVTREFHRVK